METETTISSKDEVNYVGADSAINWDEYFMLQAMVASFKSKDPITKVGAVFVDQYNHQVTMGYNGFVAGLNETELPWGKDKSVPLEHQKYAYVVHAEANAILHSPRPLLDTKVYVTLFPCYECAKLLASCKVSEVIYLSDKYRGEESNRIAKRIFHMAKIKVRHVSMPQHITSTLGEYFKKLLEVIE